MAVQPRRDVLHRGSVPRPGRRPRSVDTRRRCREEGCNTVLSRYNQGDTCYLHAPVVFPRVRGVILAEGETVTD